MAGRSRLDPSCSRAQSCSRALRGRSSNPVAARRLSCVSSVIRQPSAWLRCAACTISIARYASSSPLVLRTRLVTARWNWANICSPTGRSLSSDSMCRPALSNHTSVAGRSINAMPCSQATCKRRRRTIRDGLGPGRRHVAPRADLRRRCACPAHPARKNRGSSFHSRFRRGIGFGRRASGPAPKSARPPDTYTAPIHQFHQVMRARNRRGGRGPMPVVRIGGHALVAKHQPRIAEPGGDQLLQSQSWPAPAGGETRP